MRYVHWIATERVGQLTGSERAPGHLTDPIDWPLTNDSGQWRVAGVDLGANTMHNGQLYFFFGDVIPTQADDVRPRDSDLVAWTDDRRIQRHGGHVAENSWNFFLPNDHQVGSPLAGQSDWRFCRKCHSLFWAFQGSPAGSICQAGDAHDPAGWNFSLPNDHQGATASTGQPQWRYCAHCHGLFWNGQPAGSRCPAGGEHAAVGWEFFLPNDRQGAGPHFGQGDWRHCGTCGILFWNGSSFKGTCPGAPGGGFRLNAVIGESGLYEPFRVDGNIDLLKNGETPVGAFSYGQRVHVFVWVGEKDRSAPQAGTYLVTKADPAQPGTYRYESLFSPLRSFPSTPNVISHFNPKGFWQVSPWVVSNAAHPGLPAPDGDGVILFGHGHDEDLRSDAVHLAWMPLSKGPVELMSVQYYTGDQEAPSWSPLQADAKALFPRPNYTALSAAWLEGPRLWILLYTRAGFDRDPYSTVVARMGPTPWSLEDAAEIEIFNPDREQAFGRYLYRPGVDPVKPFEPPGRDPEKDNGYAYGAFLLTPYTTWDNATKELGIYYLLSTFSPYQVHVMHTRLRLTSFLEWIEWPLHDI